MSQNPAAEKTGHMTSQGKRQQTHVVRALRDLEAIDVRRDSRVEAARSLLLDYVESLPAREQQNLRTYFGPNGVPTR
jgi:hypothetical protein